jgi:hypothetical protein
MMIMATWRENRRITEDVFEIASGNLSLVEKAYSTFDDEPTKEELKNKIREVK